MIGEVSQLTESQFKHEVRMSAKHWYMCCKVLSLTTAEDSLMFIQSEAHKQLIQSEEKDLMHARNNLIQLVGEENLFRMHSNWSIEYFLKHYVDWR